MPGAEAAEWQAFRAVLNDPVLGQEARALCSPGSRREARDRHAMSVLLASLLERDSSVIDVGAHSGAVLRDVVRVAPAGRHIAYEPIPEFALYLATEFPHVTVVEAALSDQTGTSSFVHVDSAPEFSGLRERDYHGFEKVIKHEITVRTERLDDVIPEGFEPRLIKIDVEGAEMLVMRRAMETLRRFRPRIIFEHGIGASDHDGTSPADVYQLLSGELNMRIFDLDGRGPYSRREFETVYPEPIWNFLATP
jgi:FkbM family methyltransferase